LEGEQERGRETEREEEEQWDTNPKVEQSGDI